MRLSVRSAMIVGAVLVVLCGAGAVGGVSVASAAGGVPSGWWLLSSGARPEVLPRESRAEIVVTAENLGTAGIDGAGSPIVMRDELPAGLRLLRISADAPAGNKSPDFSCEQVAVTCTYEKELPAYDSLEMRLEVEVLPGAQSGELNRGFVSGGDVPATGVERRISIGEAGASTPFGVEEYSPRLEAEGGGLDEQAGSHPFQFTTTVGLNQGVDENVQNDGELGEKPEVQPAGADAKDVFTRLPAGLFGDPVPVAQCSLGKFLTDVGGSGNECPAQSAIGVASVLINVTGVLGMTTFTVPVFNLEPYAGEPARLGFFIPAASVPVLLDPVVRSGEDYGITIDVNNITQTAGLIAARVTVWGDPGAPVHNTSRGWGCLEKSNHASTLAFPCEESREEHSPAFLTAPTSCDGPLQTSVEADSWSEPGIFKYTEPIEPEPAMTGCNRLRFEPVVSASPTTVNAANPSGLNFNLDFHDEGLLSGESDVQSQLDDTTVVLPEGMTVDPSAGVGLKGCTETQYGEELTFVEEQQHGKKELHERTDAERDEGKGCPNQSQLGTVTIETPLLTQRIEGSVFAAQPYENQFGSLVALYVIAYSAEKGVLVRLAGHVIPNPVTGQLTTVFTGAPQLPFSHFNFHFREGNQAPLITPALCGSYTVQAGLTPWSEPLQELDKSASFTITQGYNEGSCPSGGVPFDPQITAGMLNNNAGAYSELYVDLSRNDSEQEISEFSTVLPPGMSGVVANVPQCPEGDIEAARRKTGAQEEADPSCPSDTQIGRTEVGTGVGPVLAYVPGKVYFAGPFKGAPFSIVSVTSAKVGPYDLGTVVLRFGLNINPYTAQVSVEPSSSEPIPTIIEGIVTHVRDIKVYIDRPEFTINSTSCEKMDLSSTLHAHEGGSAAVSSSYQAANCASLKFEPKVTASVSGKVTKTNGTSFHLTVSKPSVQGEQADLKKFKVELPVQLPSRLTTLQKACTSAQFEANPAGCPAASVIGFMKTHTPLLPVPVEGPMYFVSHGGEAWPSLEIVLQGDGVKVILIGQTHISGSGITSSTFNAVPDVPFSSAEVELHNGPYSALTGLGSLCAPTTTTTVKKKVTVKVKVHGHVRKKTVTKKVKQTKATSLLMPTEMVAQNGTSVYTTTHVSVTECPQAKAAAVKKHAKKARKGKRKKGGHGKKGR